MAFKPIHLLLLVLTVILLEFVEDEVLVVLMQMQSFFLIYIVQLFEDLAISSFYGLQSLLILDPFLVLVELI